MMSSASKNRRLSRSVLLPRLARFVLEQGLGTASLRPLARAAGTSDRMLIYHFGNKEALIAEVLAHIARSYASLLDEALGEERPATRRRCLARILSQAREPRLEPYAMLWWEVVAGAARGAPGYREAASAMIETQLAWLETRMPPGDPDPAGGARYLLTLLEGTLLLSATGHARLAREGLQKGLLDSGAPAA